MKNNELISIILPVYNGEKYISLAIESCLNQSYSNIELIIVNDCSTDGTLEVITPFLEKDHRITVLNNPINLKLPASLNIGHRIAKGDFITWTSDDNIYKFDAIEILVNELENREADVVYSDFIMINEIGSILTEVEYGEFENNIFGNFIGASFLYKKEVFQRNNGYDENLFLVEDYDFWLRAIVHSKFSHIKKKLYYYRKHDDSLTYQVKYINETKELWKNNLKKMYANFCFLVENEENEEIAIFLTNGLSFQKTAFEWFVNNHETIKKFKTNLKLNTNFNIKSTLIEKVFLIKTIDALRQSNSSKSKLSDLFFVLSNYGRVLGKNELKKLVKYFLKVN
ncbi:glycosyltransferase family A protein [Flavobacterium ovatum]|uniref:glycosyltransferase family 2 protein n=1 Tax=Flavobacterium ovatum TaxID=1928857 RepID=UPI00344BCA85